MQMYVLELAPLFEHKATDIAVAELVIMATPKTEQQLLPCKPSNNTEKDESCIS